MFGVSAVSRVRQALDAAHASQGSLNAFTFIDDDRAMQRAEQIDARVQAGEYAGPLAGVPIGLKDLIDQAGCTTTCGSAFYRHEAETTAPAIARLEEAGAVIIGRTGLHEWAFGFSSENPHFGPVRNPWDPSTSTGGSSGGSGAAVAAGVTPISIGTDTGGSVRVPAGLCGCFGLKTTHGRVPLEGVYPLVSSLDTVGPLADSIDNLEQAFRAMADEQQPLPTDFGALRIGIPQPWYEMSPTDDEVAAGFEEALDRLKELGHQVHPLQLPDAYPPGLIWEAIAEEVTDVHARFLAEGKPYGEDVAERIRDAQRVGSAQTLKAREWQSMIRSRFSDAFETVDFLVTPTVPVMRKEIGNDMLGGHHYRKVLSWFTALGNQTLNPSIAVPLTGSGSPPVSIQLMSPANSELKLLGFGRALESHGAIGFRVAPSGLSSLERQ